jgi:RND family efflux transporter MFP subunit
MRNKAINNHNKMKYIHSRNSVFALSILTLFATCLYSCSNSGSVEKKETTAAEEHTKSASEVSVTKKQFDALKIETGNIEQKNLIDVLKSTGFLKVPPQNKANITVALGGTVKNILVQEGKHVSKGQTLLTLTNPEFIKMQEEYLDAKSQLIFAEAEYNRQKELSSKNVASQKTFQQVESTYNSLRAKFNSLNQQLILLDFNTNDLTQETISSVINVISPINGNISKIFINIGANAEASKTLMDVVDNSHLHLDLFVFEQELPKIKNGQTIDFSLTNLPGKTYSATIFSIGSAFENETKTIPLHAEITGNKDGLIEGMNVTGSINLGHNLVPAVPSSSIASFSGNDYIFIVSDLHSKEEKDSKKKEIQHDVKDKSEHSQEQQGEIFGFKRIQIKKGISNGGYTEITPLEEIPADAKVVINGAFYLMAMLTNAGEEE